MSTKKEKDASTARDLPPVSRRAPDASTESPAAAERVDLEPAAAAATAAQRRVPDEGTQFEEGTASLRRARDLTPREPKKRSAQDSPALSRHERLAQARASRERAAAEKATAEKAR